MSAFSSLTSILQHKVSALAGSLTDAGINLREHLKDPPSFGKLLDDQGQKIATLSESIERAKITLPDGTGREVYAWEYEALEKLASDNGRDVEEFLGETIDIEEGRIVKARLCHMSLKDISVISWLTSLQDLWLFENQIQDLSPLTDLINLRRLSLFENQIQDLSPLAGLINLHKLSLDNNQIQDISPLAGLINLHKLSLDNNQIQDIAPVSGLTNLQALSLERNQMQDINIISGLTNLQTLELGENQIQDLSPLASLASLRELWLEDNQILDLSPLAGLKSLQVLSVVNSQIPNSQRPLIEKLKNRGVRVYE